MPVIPNQQLPSSIDPAQANPNDSLFQTLVRKAVRGGQILGLDNPVSAIMGVAGPLEVGAMDLMDPLLKKPVSEVLDNVIPSNWEPQAPPSLVNSLKSGQAVDTLLDFLKGFKPSSSDTQSKIQRGLVDASTTSPNFGRPPSRLNLPVQVYDKYNNPVSSLPFPLTDMNQRYLDRHDAILRSTAPLRSAETPLSISSLDQLPDALGSARSALSTPPSTPALSGKSVTGPNIKGTLARAKLNEEMVKRIRNIGDINEITKEFPNINRNTLLSALTKQTWSHVK